MEEAEDELVPFTRIVEELGWPAYKVRLAMGKAGEKLKAVKEPRRYKGGGRHKSLYPLVHTVELLTEGSRGETVAPEVASEKRVPFEQVVRELGWSPTTVRRYVRSAGRSLIAFTDPADNRKKLYPLTHALKVIRREAVRVQARRDRSRDQGAGYWLALAELKVAASHLRQVSRDLATASRKVTEAHNALRKNPPTISLVVATLPEPGLALSYALSVLVSPLRLNYWKAVAADIDLLRGEGRNPEQALADLRQKLVAAYRQLQQYPDSNRQLWEVLDEIVRVKRPRSKGRKRQP